MVVPTAAFIIPHPDDETLSMWPAIHLLGSGYDVHFIFMSRGGVTPNAVRLNGLNPSGTPQACALPAHNYIHNPTQEGYKALTQEDIGMLRLQEGIAAARAMGMIPPTNGGVPGRVFCHDENLPLEWGNGSGHGDPTEAGIQAAEDIIRKYVDLLPEGTTHFYTMSPTDDHPDHAACGKALRRLKGRPWLNEPGDPIIGPLLVAAMFFVSKLYWGPTPPRPSDVLAERCAWYPNVYPDNTKVLARRSEYAAHLRTKVVVPYVSDWWPMDVTLGETAPTTSRGKFCVGGHQVYSQFWNAILNPDITVSALWHP